MNLTNLTNKHYLSLAALMLLAHAVPLAVANSEIILTEEEKAFVQSYINFGKKLVYILVCSGIVWFIYTRVDYSWIQYISTACNSIVILGIILGTYAILNDTIIRHSTGLDIHAISNLFKTHLLTGKK